LFPYNYSFTSTLKNNIGCRVEETKEMLNGRNYDLNEVKKSGSKSGIPN
jgi:hypothetical protein